MPKIPAAHAAQRFLLVRHIHLRPRLFVSALLGLLVVLLLQWQDWPGMQTATRMVIGWNTFACLNLLLTAHMMLRSNHDTMRTRACQQDEGRRTVLALVVLAALAALGTILAELSVVKDLHGAERLAHIGLAALTIVSSWFFTQVMFALHYAHDFYSAQIRSRDAGLQFPGTEKPDYGDFLYFACIIGTSAQTADVSFTTSAMRRTGLLHCVLAFFFNTTLVALTINIASGLL